MDKNKRPKIRLNPCENIIQTCLYIKYTLEGLKVEEVKTVNYNGSKG